MYIKKNYHTDSGLSFPFFPENRLTAQYWLGQISHKIIMDKKEIQTFNHDLFSNHHTMTDPLSFPSTLSRDEIITLIDSISLLPTQARFFATGATVSKKHIESYMENTGKTQLNESNPISYGLVIKRAALRTFPTTDQVFDYNMQLDRFQESAIYVGQPVAVICHSLDHAWYLIRSDNYLAWIAADSLAITDNVSQIQDFMHSPHTLIVTGAHVQTTYNPRRPETSEQRLDMGVRLPLLVGADKPQQLHQHHTYMSHVVMLPTRENNGTLTLQPTVISKFLDVQTEYLEYRSDNIIHQVFKLAGEWYDWGGAGHGRDCSSMIVDVYRCFGIMMPRNTSQQALGHYGDNHYFDSNTSLADRLRILKQVETGDILYIPGHCMMALGHDEDGFLYVIHNVKEITYMDNRAMMRTLSLNGIFITRLLDMYTDKKTSYLREITTIKRIINSR